MRGISALVSRIFGQILSCLSIFDRIDRYTEGQDCILFVFLTLKIQLAATADDLLPELGYFFACIFLADVVYLCCREFWSKRTPSIVESRG